MEDLRMLVQEEGRAARNLIAFHVDVASPTSGKAVNRKPPSSPRLVSEVRMTKRSTSVSKSGSRVRSASLGRDKKSELQALGEARYWAFLFGNLERAVDDIYQTCETDESVSECKEAILVLENFTRDFHNLIKWFKLKKEYENTPPPQRPTSLAWEIRKSSPGKVIRFMNSKFDKANKNEKPSPVKKQLNFCSDVKLSSAEEKTKPTPSDGEQILSNQYGLSFGDVNLKEHLTHEETLILTDEGKLTRKLESIQNTSELDGKGNLLVIADSIILTETETQEYTSTLSDQSSQTDSVTCQNVKNNLKPTAPFTSLAKKPPPLAKSVINTSVKTSLTPLAVNKTVPGVSSRKTVPVSPTSTTAPRSVIPGRNVAAVTFVPSKKPIAQIQVKGSPGVPKTAPNVHKTSSIPSEKVEECKGNNDSIDSNKVTETKLVMEKLTSNVAVKLQGNEKIAEVPTKDVNCQKLTTTTNDIEAKNVAEVPTDSEEITTRKDTSVQKSEETNKQNLSDKENKSDSQDKKIEPTSDQSENSTDSEKRFISDVQNNTTVLKKSESTQSDEKSVATESNVNEKPANNVKIVRKNVPKVDKCVMTDLPYVPKQPAAKVSSLLRNKTAPSLVRKSNEAINAPDIAKPNNPAKPSVNTQLKQSSIPEVVSEKPAYAAVSKVFRSNTAIELRPKFSSSSRVNYASKFSIPGKQNSLQNGKSPSQTTSSSSSSVCKSEQGFRRRNSVDEDGWETVKGRSRWRLTQSFTNIKSRSATARTRYHLPSPATSLPALTLAMEEPEPEPVPAKMNKEKQNQEIARGLKTSAKKTNKLSIRSAKETLRGDLEKPKSKSKEDVAEKKLKSNTEDGKRIFNIRLKNVEIKKKSLREEKLELQDMKIEKYLDMLSSEDERMNEEEIRKSRELDEEEKMLTKEIQDLEKSEIDVDTETDEAETDGDDDTVKSSESEEDRIEALKASYENVCHKLSWSDQMEAMDKLERLMAQDTSTKGLPWAERMATLQQLEELVARSPGRALELHQKLSSPSRRRPLPDTIQRHTARQASAQLKRKQLLQEKQAKMRELVNKVEAVKMAQEHLKTERMLRLENKQKRAEENRASHLRSIQRKAHDEEEKLREIAFINELEAQNKRHDFMAHCQEQQDRLQGIVDERQRRQEEKAAKEAAVEERKRIIEAERQERLEKIQEKRRKREERIGREQQEKEKERLEMAREKARDREERMQALQAAQLANVEELQKKIQQKQFDSARRHEENIEQIRQRALESGALRGAADDEAPTLTPYDTHKLCRICNVLIVSEVYLLSHLRGKAHQEAVKDLDDSEEVIIDAPADKTDAKLAQDRERQRALRKRCKKLRTRMAQRGEEYLTKLSTIATKKPESPNKGRLIKCLRDVDKLHASQGVGQWPNNSVTLLERNLAEINRILDKQNALDQKVFRDLNGFTTLSNILNLALDIPKNMSPYLPPKCFLTTCLVYSLACTNNPDNSRYVFFSNKISLVLDLLLNRLNALIPDDYKPSNKSSANLPSDPIAGALMKLFALILTFSQENVTGDVPDMSPRLQDIISYTVCVGVVDKLALYCGSVRDPIDNNTQATSFLLNAIQLLTTLAQTKCGLLKGDPTQLVATLKVTELVGGVSMLYGMLLHQGTPARDPSSPPPELPAHTITVTSYTLQLLIAVARLDLCMFQSVLGAEGMSLQLRHIASYLLWYCSYSDERELLHKVIQVVGYFAVNHYDNQMILQSGHMPTVLQQLCNLPFEYFSDPALSSELFPTLLACCHHNTDNRAILEQELSYQLLEDFKKSDAASTDLLIQLLK